jgi:type VI secretion system Hcp family effector
MSYTYSMSLEKAGQVPGSTQNEVEIQDFSFNLGQTLNAGSSSGGGGGGKATNVNPFNITKQTDSASPNLFQACTAQEVFPRVVFNIYETGSSPNKIKINSVTLKNGVIQSVIPFMVSGKQGHKFSFGYDSVSVESMSPILVALLKGK